MKPNIELTLLSKKEIKNSIKGDHTRSENLMTQPLSKHRVFNEPSVITESWYPICPSKLLQKGKAKSFTILQQRIALYRDNSGKVNALDAFCPHMGTDLGNGEVVNNELRCYFHHWTFGQDGKLTDAPCVKNKSGLEKVNVNSYPTKEKYGFIWVYSNSKETCPPAIPQPPALENDEVSAFHFGRTLLFVHHHIMMTNAVDLQHFKSVHKLDVEFDAQLNDSRPNQFDWTLEGDLPKTSLLLRITRYILGPKFRYKVLYAGGNITTISYGYNQKWRGHSFSLPAINILWAANPTKKGVSEVDIFFVVKKFNGLLAPFKRLFMYFLSISILALLKDDDIKAFPNMRYDVGKLTAEDKSLAKFIQLTNKLKISEWTNHEDHS